MPQIFRRTSLPKCDFNKVVKQLHWPYPVNMLHIFRTLFPKNTSGGLLLYIFSDIKKKSSEHNQYHQMKYTHFFYKKHFFKQRQSESGKKINKI